jgi:hypothetical protein
VVPRWCVHVISSSLLISKQPLCPKALIKKKHAARRACVQYDSKNWPGLYRATGTSANAVFGGMHTAAS